MPDMPRKSEVEEWYKPAIIKIKEICDSFDVVFIGTVEGPISDALTYADMTLLCEAIYEAPELVDRTRAVQLGSWHSGKVQ
jgi:hypothetical protein